MMRIHILFMALLSWAFATQAQTFTLTSDLGGQATKVEEFNGFGCSGENLSPALSWENAPTGTKKLRHNHV